MNDYPSRVTLFDDGVYRWSYDMDMWRNRFLLRLLMKLLGIICAALCAFTLVLIGPSHLTPLRIGIVLLIYLAVPLLALLIYAVCALVMRGVYHLRFEMDDSAVALVQSADVRRRNDAMAAVATIVGIAAGKPGEAIRTGVSLKALNAVGTTPFSTIRRLRAYPRDDVIDLREFFGMNQIYVNAEDFPFVRDFILERVPEKARARSDAGR